MIASGGNAAAFTRLPHAEAGNRIGLFGGSFNPPHPGHVMVAHTALQRLQLDQVWWLVTPGNPLKSHGGLAPLAERVSACEKLAQHPQMRVCAVEARLGSAYTADTVKRLQVMRPSLQFCWIMGADNLAGFHRWQAWREIMEAVPVAVVNRPGATLSPLFSPMAIRYGRARLKEANAAALLKRPAPNWTFLHCPLNATSSSFLRDIAARHKVSGA
ncbi:nicotinate-nucleotide adenylyltransferase [Polycladidibacter hongkongensis]|uniref:nicotinate-nucleotide adenylyltransferase n=1 Tax=Polycladidibacter hongkongensis TaxID=1647556 RepID=UPI00082BDE6F|nr:nicotinate-nucleotide adenylyltransferase [Pseudovibrio hongkongensis]